MLQLHEKTNLNRFIHMYSCVRWVLQQLHKMVIHSITMDRQTNKQSGRFQQYLGMGGDGLWVCVCVYALLFVWARVCECAHMWVLWVRVISLCTLLEVRHKSMLWRPIDCTEPLCVALVLSVSRSLVSLQPIIQRCKNVSRNGDFMWPPVGRPWRG